MHLLMKDLIELMIEDIKDKRTSYSFVSVILFLSMDAIFDNMFKIEIEYKPLILYTIVILINIFLLIYYYKKYLILKREEHTGWNFEFYKKEFEEK